MAMTSDPVFVGCTGQPLGPSHRSVIREIIAKELERAQQEHKTPPVDDSVEQ